MKVTGEHGIGKILQIILQICLYIGMIVLFVLPFVLNKFGFKLGVSMYIVYPNGIVLLMIMYKFIKLFNNLRLRKPFCDENVKLVKGTAILSLVCSVLWGIDFLYEIIFAHSPNIVFSGILLFLCILFIGDSIALYILSELLRKATKYKKENDLTI